MALKSGQSSVPVTLHDIFFRSLSRHSTDFSPLAFLASDLYLVVSLPLTYEETAGETANQR
jgi:hypothetical protein